MSVIYRPRFANQIDDGGLTGRVDCMGWTAAFAIDRATLGGVVVTGRQIRLASNEPRPDPGSPGLTLAQVTSAAYRLTRVVLTPRRGTWLAMLKYLGPSAVLLPIDYDQLPAAFSCQANFDDLHGVLLNNENTSPVTCADGKSYGPKQAALTYDPLCDSFRWVPLVVLRKAAEKYARRVGYTGGVIYATTRKTPLIDAN